MRELLETIGPVLEMVGWAAGVPAIALLVTAWVLRRHYRRWRPSPAEVRILEGQPCAVWTAPDGTAVSGLLGEDAAPPGSMITIYHQDPDWHVWLTHEPPDRSRPIRTAGWVLLVVAVLANVVGLATALLPHPVVSQLLLSPPLLS
jgi:heme A synthase